VFQLNPTGKPPLRHTSAPTVGRISTPVMAGNQSGVPGQQGSSSIISHYDRSQYNYVVNRMV